MLLYHFLCLIPSQKSVRQAGYTTKDFVTGRSQHVKHGQALQQHVWLIIQILWGSTVPKKTSLFNIFIMVDHLGLDLMIEQMKQCIYGQMVDLCHTHTGLQEYPHHTARQRTVSKARAEIWNITGNHHHVITVATSLARKVKYKRFEKFGKFANCFTSLHKYNKYSAKPRISRVLHTMSFLFFYVVYLILTNPFSK